MPWCRRNVVSCFRLFSLNSRVSFHSLAQWKSAVVDPDFALKGAGGGGGLFTCPAVFSPFCHFLFFTQNKRCPGPPGPLPYIRHWSAADNSNRTDYDLYRGQLILTELQMLHGRTINSAWGWIGKHWHSRKNHVIMLHGGEKLRNLKNYNDGTNTRGVLPEKLGGGVPPASQNPYPIYYQNLWYSLPYLWPDQRFETLFMTWLLISDLHCNWISSSNQC